MKQITLAVALFISLFATLNSAAAQCNGNFGANSACGTVGGGLPGPIPFSSIISGGGQVVGPSTSTIGCAALWANTTGTQLANNCNIQFVGSTLTLDSPFAFALGSDATGDIWYRNSSGLVTRLPVGTNGYVLTVSSGLPTWVTVGTAPSITVGTTTVSGGTSPNCLNDNSGTLGGVNCALLGTSDQTLSGGANVTPASLSTGSITVDCGKVPLQYITASTSGWTITAPSNDGSCILYVLNPSSTAGAITFSGFTVGSNTGDTYLTTANDKFFLSIARINGVSTYVWKALQ